MTSLPGLVLLVACGASMSSAQTLEPPRHVRKTFVLYTTLTCEVPPGYRERNIYQFEILRQTERGFVRSLVNKSRDPFFPGLDEGDVSTLFSATGQVIENNASSSFLNCSFVLDDSTHGQYLCNITFSYITENKKETESTNIFIGEPSTIKENIISSGFSAYFTPAFRVQLTWYLHHLPLHKVELKENILENSARKDSEPCQIICRRGEVKPCLHVYPDVLAHNLYYFYDTRKREHIIKVDVCTINGSSCSSVQYIADVETKDGLTLVEALVSLNSNTDPSEKVNSNESIIKENTTTHNDNLKCPECNSNPLHLLIPLIVVSSLLLICCCCFIARFIISKIAPTRYSRVPIQENTDSMGVLSGGLEMSNRQEQPSNQAVSNGQEQSSGQMVTNGQAQASGQAMPNGQEQSSGQMVTNSQVQSSDQAVSNGQGQPGGQMVTNGQAQASGQAMPNGQEQSSGQMVTNSQVQSSDQAVSNGQGQPGGQMVTNGQAQASGQAMSNGQGQSSNQSVSNGQAQASGQTVSNGQGQTSDQLTSSNNRCEQSQHLDMTNVEGGSSNRRRPCGQERVEPPSSEGNDRSNNVTQASENLNDVNVSRRDSGSFPTKETRI